MKFWKFIISFMLILIGMSVANAASYTIKQGDTLSAIAIAHKTTVPKLLEMNPNVTNPDKIFAGRTLVLSASPVARAPSGAVRGNSVVSLPKPEVQKAQAEVAKSACNTIRAIEQFGYPKEVAASFIAMVKEGSRLPNREIREETEHTYIVEHAQTRYSFTASNVCTFGKGETIKLSALSEDPNVGVPKMVQKDADVRNGKAFGEDLRSVVGTKDQLRKFLRDAIGPPYDVDLIAEEMERREGLIVLGVNVY